MLSRPAQAALWSHTPDGLGAPAMTLTASTSEARDAFSHDASAARILALRGAPASARALLMALLSLQGGRLTVIAPDGARLQFGAAPGPKAVLDIADYGFARRVLSGGDIGFAEGWIEGEWTSPDLAALLTLIAANADRLMRLVIGGPVQRFCSRFWHGRRANTRSGARRNILAHYDLGNAFFEAWLDPSMTYSSARFGPADTLEQAQQRKYAALADTLDLRAGDRVLEIGCGWGGFAEFAARRGACVTALTISDAQFGYARRRLERTGLAGQVEIRRQDYRDVDGQFDKVASIEMIEAVGERYWPDYFAKIAAVLKPGGRAAIQAILIRDDLFETYRRHVDFIQRYVFPGGLLPSLAELRRQTARAGLAWLSCDAFASCYARTLAAWTHAFQAQWRRIAALGYDERFRRLWLFYLAYCEAGFRTRRTDVVQFALAKPA